MAARAWIMVAEAVLTGSSRASLQLLGMEEKPPDSGGFFNFPLCGDDRGITLPVCWTSGGRFAKRRPLAKAFRAGSGRIAQLVEQMTLNHRVPGSSPGAPTITTY